MLENINDVNRNITNVGKNNNDIIKKPVQSQQVNYKSESLDEFASNLPDWNLLPPQMIIKRVRRNI